ncbi:MAG TPA: phage integrase SAM-like domain-containing protein, partial [Bacteroidales bacterium]|nr:phage integrase SAM-like domain-containing protein [Bacteroidales bacterium]
MVKFQVVIRPKRKDKNGLVNVEVMASCGGVRVHLVTGFKVKPQQFRSGMVVTHAAADQINTAVQLQMAGYIERSIRFTGSFAGMSATRLRRMLTEGAARQVTFESVIRQQIDQCQRKGAVKSAKLLLYTYNKIANRYKGITFDQITPSFLRNFEADLTKEGIKQNTIAL